MNPGFALAALSLVTTVGNLVTYYPKMMGNHATLRPRLEQALMFLALILAVGAFAMHPGWLGGAIAIVASIPALLFLLATFTSGLPDKATAVAAGELAPDFQLKDADGNAFRLSALRGSPVLIKFYRGYWCPYCVAELDQLNRYADQFESLGVKLIAVSSDNADELRMFAKKHDWAIRLLADPDLAAHRLYNVQHRKFAARRGPFREIAIPTTILLDRNGRVLWLERTPDFRVRPQADMVLAKTRALLHQPVAAAQDCEVCVA